MIIIKNSTIYAAIYTLGCKVNQYESEVIKEKLENHGYIFKDFKHNCDIYIINSCAVTAESSRKSAQIIRRAIKSNPDAVIAVTGCQSQLAVDIIASIDGIDIICGSYNKMMITNKIIELIEKGIKPIKPIILSQTFECDGKFESMSVKRFGRTRAYIKIQDGCDNKCSYCIIPKIRGNVRFKEVEQVVAESVNLVNNGCKEIVLIGTETSSYKEITDLIKRLQIIDGLDRIRLGSLDPSFMRPEITDELMSNSKLAPHFHLSIQSGSDRILRSMRRKYNTEIALRNIEYIKKINKEVNFTTDIMVGYPDESEIDFNDTVSFAQKVEFLHIHIFTYSIRPGTESADMPNQIPENVKIHRSEILSNKQKEIKRSIYKRYVKSDKPMDVLFETYDGQTAIGHTPNFLEIETLSDNDISDKIIKIKPIKVNHIGDKIIGEILK